MRKNTYAISESMGFYRFLIVSFILLNFLNFGKYLYENAAFKNYLAVVPQDFYKYIRLVVLLSALLVLDLRFRKNILQFFRKNQDVLLFIALSFISTLFSKDLLISITYTLWTCLSLYLILGYLTLISKSSNDTIFLENRKNIYFFINSL